MAYLSSNKGRGQRTFGQYMGDRGGDIFKSISRILMGAGGLVERNKKEKQNKAFKQALIRKGLSEGWLDDKYLTDVKSEEFGYKAPTEPGQWSQIDMEAGKEYMTPQDMNTDDILKMIAAQKEPKTGGSGDPYADEKMDLRWLEFLTKPIPAFMMGTGGIAQEKLKESQGKKHISNTPTSGGGTMSLEQQARMLLREKEYDETPGNIKGAIELIKKSKK